MKNKLEYILFETLKMLGGKKNDRSIDFIKPNLYAL